MPGVSESPIRIARTESPTTRKRPRWFRALGNRDAPEKIQIEGDVFSIIRTYKHDSWAATALYQCGERKIVCKFNREQSLFGLPGRWIGLFLSHRESAMLQRLADIPNIPNHSGDVVVDHRKVPTASAHEYIEGQPLSWCSDVDAAFFKTLRDTVLELHRRNIAYVDLHKLENVIVDEQGAPHLIDFQISVKLWNIFPVSILLNILQKSDLYHLDKHVLRFGPDPNASIDRPWWIRAHRCVAVPFRTMRRRFLTAIGVRKKGKANSEHFVEEGLARKADKIPQPNKRAA
ncbi:MAG: hypothetical protein P8J91_08405 [Pirellulaceae bacterium]|nr:hypothetical protein [Pirellulaceae bacterium]MDG2103758.1 hypothetical protein [Pirellulaceae bacterium]